MKNILFIVFFSLLAQSSFLSSRNQYNQAVVDVNINNNNPYQQIQQSIKDNSSQLHHLSYRRLAYLVDSYGPRMWGSQSLALAIQDLYTQISTLGFDNVAMEELPPFQSWKRGYESLTLLDPRPFPQKLNMIGLGLSISGNVTANVIVVRSFDELDKLGENAIRGKIVCYNQAWTTYRESVVYRLTGASRASKYGAVGMLLRSVASASINSPHTGMLSYDSSSESIPAAAISIEDADMLQRMQDRGQKIRVHLEMYNEVYVGTSHNLIAEITGSQYPEEILLMGGHIDSWDTGSQTGANDDAGGVMVCLEALHVLQTLGLRPKRTIRFIAWSGEEMGQPGKGADQYMIQHAQEIPKHVLAFESDTQGPTKPYGFGFNGGPVATQIIINLAAQFLVSINASTIKPGDGYMTDTIPLAQAGVPIMRQEVEDTPSGDYYFQFHHSAGDTMDVIDPDNMDDNVVAIASMMFLLADLDQTLPRY